MDNLLTAFLDAPTATQWLIFWCTVLQVADSLTTIAILHHGGHERNPVMRWLIELLGAGFALALKVTIAGALCFWLGLFAPTFYLVGASVFYIGIVLNNAIVLRKLTS